MLYDGDDGGVMSMFTYIAFGVLVLSENREYKLSDLENFGIFGDSLSQL